MGCLGVLADRPVFPATRFTRTSRAIATSIVAFTVTIDPCAAGGEFSGESEGANMSEPSGPSIRKSS